MIAIRIYSFIIYLISGKVTRTIMNRFKKNSIIIRLIGFIMASSILIYSYYYFLENEFEPNFYE